MRTTQKKGGSSVIQTVTLGGPLFESGDLPRDVASILAEAFDPTGEFDRVIEEATTIISSPKGSKIDRVKKLANFLEERANSLLHLFERANTSVQNVEGRGLNVHAGMHLSALEDFDLTEFCTVLRGKAQATAERIGSRLFLGANDLPDHVKRVINPKHLAIYVTATLLKSAAVQISHKDESYMVAGGQERITVPVALSALSKVFPPDHKACEQFHERMQDLAEALWPAQAAGLLKSSPVRFLLLDTTGTENIYVGTVSPRLIALSKALFLPESEGGKFVDENLLAYFVARRLATHRLQIDTSLSFALEESALELELMALRSMRDAGFDTGVVKEMLLETGRVADQDTMELAPKPELAAALIALAKEKGPKRGRYRLDVPGLSRVVRDAAAASA